MTDLWKDVRYALRTLRRAPVFTAVAVITLALGIGANTGIFSLVNAALLRALPYPDASRLVRVYTVGERGKSTTSPPDFVDYRAQSRSFDGLAAYHGGAYALTGDGEAEQVQAAVVTGDFFHVLGVPLALGRPISPADAEPGAEPVVVLGNALWQSRFGGDLSVLGRRIVLDGEPTTVIGVAAPGFAYPRDARMWTPRSFGPQDLATQRGAHYLSLIARLAPGATVERAAADMARIAESLATDYPKTNRNSSATVTTLREALVGNSRKALLILLGAVGLVLLIACANVANLLVARALGRRRDLALRHALGATRGRLTRLVLIESMVLALVGGALGVLVALWGMPLVARLRPNDAFLQAATLDLRVLGVTLAVSLATGLLFGIFPALRLVPSHGLAAQLVGGGRGGSATREAHNARRALVVAEMALAFVLLVAAGLLMRSFVALRQTDVGYQTASRLTFDLAAPDATYDSPEKIDGYYARITERLRSIPGVSSVGATMVLPLSGDSYGISTSSLDGRALPDEEQDRLSTQIRAVRPEYFAAMGIPILRGRAIGEQDRPGAPDAVVLSEAAAAMMFPGEDALGHELRVGTSFGAGRGNAGGTVVGIAGNTRELDVATDNRPLLYVSHAQFPVNGLSYVLETTRPPQAVVPAVRAAVAAVDPNVPMYAVNTMEGLFSESIAQPRFVTTLLGLFAVTALLLAAVGLYGVIAYGVGERTREFGIRMALGARQGDVLAQVMRGGWALGLTGIAIGLLAAVGATRLLASQLYGVTPTDALTLGAAVAVLLPVALLATWIPARRAMRVDPGAAIRAE